MIPIRQYVMMATIKESNVFCCKVEVVRIISEREVQVWGIVHNTSDSPRVLRFVLLFCKDYGLVMQYIVRSVKNVFSINDFVGRMPLFTDDKEGPKHVNLIKSDKVKVPSVKDIASQRLICEPIHCIDIMHIGIRDAIEYGNLRDDIHLSVNLDARLRVPELRPVEERHAKVNRCGIHCVESAIRCSFLDGFGYCHNCQNDILIIWQCYNRWYKWQEDCQER